MIGRAVAASTALLLLVVPYEIASAQVRGEAEATVTVATPAPEPPRWHLDVEGDILGYFALAYSLHFHLRPADAPRWRLGFGVFGGRLPGWFVDFENWANGSGDENEGWKVRADAYALEAFYHFADSGSSLFVGAYLALQQWDLTQPSTMSAKRSHQLFIWPAVGYRWFPLGPHFFATIWAGLGIPSPGFAESHSGPNTFDEYRIYPFGSIHLGVEM